LAKPQKLADGRGLYLFVTPNGTKAWCLAYRYNGKQKSLSLGLYPVVTLGEARNRRERAKKLLAQGIDPSAHRKLDKIAAKAGENTFRVVAEELLENTVSKDAHRRPSQKTAGFWKSPSTLLALGL